MGREWPLESTERRRAADGAEYALDSRVVNLDPLEQRAVYEMRAGMWRDAELVAEETHRLDINFYFKNELLLLLEQAGFDDITVHGDHREEPPTVESDFLVFVANKRLASSACNGSRRLLTKSTSTSTRVH